MFAFGAARSRRRMSLVPMVDLVLLLLVFFMLVARFGPERAVPVRAGGGYAGPPRLVEVLPDGLRLNGVALAPRDLLAELVRLTASGGDAVVLRPEPGVDLERLTRVMALMEAAGFRNLALVEAVP